MALKRIEAPTTEPVTLAEAKAQCKVEHSDEDTMFTAIFIPAARRRAEHLTGRPLITQTWEQVLDGFPAGAIYLGKPNVQSVVSLKYLDTAGDEQTMSSDDYSLDADDASEAWVHPAINTVWPSTIDTANALRVRFTCGYGAASDVPEDVKAWMLLLIAYLHKHREAVVDGTVTALPFFDSLLDGVSIRMP